MITIKRRVVVGQAVIYHLFRNGRLFSAIRVGDVWPDLSPSLVEVRSFK